MKVRSIIKLFLCFVIVMTSAATASAGPDQYIGDTAIYSGETQYLKPNVLFIFDNNSTMGDTANVGDPYNPAVNYCAVYGWCTYATYTVFKVTGMSNYVAHIANTTSALENISCAAANTALTTTGTYSGGGSSSLRSNGTCGNGGATLVYLGNLLNYNAGGADGSTGTTQKQVDIVRDALEKVSKSLRNIINFGVMTFGPNKSGGKIIYPVSDLTTDAAYNAFIGVLPNPTAGTGEPLLSGNGRPLAEALYDAGAYFKGVYPIIYNAGSFVSPIAYSCQRNFVVVITNGDTDSDGSPKLGQTTALGLVGDYDNDGLEPGAYGLGTHYMDDVAKFIYENDLLPDDPSDPKTIGVQRVVTHAIQVFAPDKPLVRSATDSTHGRGSYYVASNANMLSDALTKIMTNIVVEANSSFVAPVVPVSPENKTYAGRRVYMGFFKPISQQYWYGNLKKYGLDANDNIVDMNGAYANYVDMDGNGVDDRDAAALPAGAINGSFRDASRSFWSSEADAGEVTKGGVGQVLANRSFTSSTGGTSPRKIYTYLGATTDLTAAGNAFTTANTSITATTLGLPAAATTQDKDKLIDFIHGIDVYDENGNNNTTEKRGYTVGDTPKPWIMGDILHSKPLVFIYSTYAFSSANESDCNTNKTMIYAGSNHGMLHAFRDCDGSEAWSYIPQDLLANIHVLPGEVHSYFVDYSPAAYVYDANKNGTIESGDKVILIFGLRRGGGVDSAPTRGYYYALDVTNPLAPQFLWRISPDTAGFSELGESWSEPKIGTINDGSYGKVVVFLGAGYDNCNEDARFGATQTFTGACVVAPTLDSGVVTSPGTSAALDPRGRGIFAVEIATLNSSGTPSFSGSGTKVWSYTHANSTSMNFSILSEVTAIDSNYDGYVDRLYAGDAGGNVWRFNISDTSPTNWTVTKIFSLNPGSGGTGDVGRKIFYKPAVTLDAGSVWLYFGTGDREHPLNRGVMDRMYGLMDRGQTAAKSESDLVDVTENLLQEGTEAQVSATLAALADPAKFGWYIKLNEASGEKALSQPVLFNKVVYFTTYSPNTIPPVDPCQPGNLGAGTIYALDYKTGEAVVNYDLTNDGTTTTNERATPPSAGGVLLRSDRKLTVGEGIPSGVVILNDVALVGIAGSMTNVPKKKGGPILPVYWLRK